MMIIDSDIGVDKLNGEWVVLEHEIMTYWQIFLTLSVFGMELK